MARAVSIKSGDAMDKKIAVTVPMKKIVNHVETTSIDVKMDFVFKKGGVATVQWTARITRTR